MLRKIGAYSDLGLTIAKIIHVVKNWNKLWTMQNAHMHYDACRVEAFCIVRNFILF